MGETMAAHLIAEQEAVAVVPKAGLEMTKVPVAAPMATSKAAAPKVAAHTATAPMVAPKVAAHTATPPMVVPTVAPGPTTALMVVRTRVPETTMAPMAVVAQKSAAVPKTPQALAARARELAQELGQSQKNMVKTLALEELAAMVGMAQRVQWALVWQRPKKLQDLTLGRRPPATAEVRPTAALSQALPSLRLSADPKEHPDQRQQSSPAAQRDQSWVHAVRQLLRNCMLHCTLSLPEPLHESKNLTVSRLSDNRSA